LPELGFGGLCVSSLLALSSCLSLTVNGGEDEGEESDEGEERGDLRGDVSESDPLSLGPDNTRLSDRLDLGTDNLHGVFGGTYSSLSTGSPSPLPDLVLVSRVGISSKLRENVSRW